MKYTDYIHSVLFNSKDDAILLVNEMAVGPARYLVFQNKGTTLGKPFKSASVFVEFFDEAVGCQRMTCRYPSTDIFNVALGD